MMDQYASISKDFRRVTPTLLFRNALLVPSFLGIVGDLTGKTSLDLGCGEGFFTRLLVDAGSSRVVGLDISEKMIELARAEEQRESRSISYHIGSASEFFDLGSFDMVTAVFLLHYAATKDELQRMADNAYRGTGNNGLFFAINTNPEFPIRKDPKYGFTRIGPEPLREGDKLTLAHFEDGKALYSFDFYHWEKHTYDEVLQKAGFAQIEWLVPEPSAATIEEFGEEFWADYRREPNHSLIVCRK